MDRLNRQSKMTAKAKAIAAKDNSRAITLHALLITAAILAGVLALTQIIQ